MRYFRGAIALSPTQDLPLLQFMRHNGYELSRGSFWWRLKRLADHGFIARHLLPMVHYDPIFAIASSGLVYLVENLGTPYSGPEAGPEVRTDGVGVAHALGVNAIHLDLLRSRTLVSWESEMEIRCRNELTAGKYAKDYDAIVTLSLGGRARHANRGDVDSGLWALYDAPRLAVGTVRLGLRSGLVPPE